MSSFTPPSSDGLVWRVARSCDVGNCVRVAARDESIVIGDTKHPDGPVLSYDRAEWMAFMEGIRQGDFDDLI